MKPAVQENRVSISQLQNKVIQRRNTEYVRNQKKAHRDAKVAIRDPHDDYYNFCFHRK